MFRCPAGHRPQRSRHLRHAPPPPGAAGAEGLPVRGPRRAPAGAGEPRSVRRPSARRPTRKRRLRARRQQPRRPRPVYVLHVRGGLRHSERVGGRVLLHQRDEPLETGFAVRKQRPCCDRSAGRIRRPGCARRRAVAGPLRAAGVRTRAGRLPLPGSDGQRLPRRPGGHPAAEVELSAGRRRRGFERTAAADGGLGGGRRAAADGPPLARPVPAGRRPRRTRGPR